METKEGALSFDVENSFASLLEIRKILYKTGKHTAQKVVDSKGFNTINIHCNVITAVKDNGINTDILYAFNLLEPPSYEKNIIPNNIICQNVAKERIENVEFLIRD